MENLKLPNNYKQNGNLIYYEGSFNYTDRIYETLFDSKGNRHVVQVDYDNVNTTIDESNYIKRIVSDHEFYEIHINKKEFETIHATFQFKFDEYKLAMPNRHQSPYQFISGIIHENVNWAESWVNHNYLLNGEYYFPIYEINIGSGNNRSVVETKISDKFFFNYPDREKAVNSINWKAREKLIKLDYLNMNDKQILVLMTKRFNEFIKIKRNHPEIF